ncbi:unnamed protein product [Nezara viridula]|uniref:Reelin domain-containing protein n=1 Tax=Nezara viridula TaxID=85310 RepID=A0A9P0DXU2_NEZVI|nr:unnamed protein product [Nezara viridula]
MYFSALLVTLLAAVAVRAFPTGVPPSVCESMMPGHGVPPQTSPSPYDIIIEKTNLQRGQSTKITIKGQKDATFRGIFVQARGDKDTPIGRFTVSDNDGKLLDCGEGEENAVSHINASDKKEITVVWTAPKDYKGEVIIYLTTVKVFDIFWVKQKSAPITIS